MERCPNGYRRVGNKCVKVSKTKTKTKSESKKIARGSMGPRKDPHRFEVYDHLQTASDPYAQLNRIGDWIYQGWQNRPNIPPFVKESPFAWAYEAAERTIDVQFEVAKNMAQGDYADSNVYSPIERDRVETIGFKPIWSPGGLQV